MATQAWTQYLQTYNIPSDPFSRSQWQSTESHTRQIPGFHPTGLQMEHKISDGKKELLQRIVKRIPDLRTAKDHFKVGVVSTLPGGGKTRFLVELLTLLEDNGIEALYYVTFNSFSRLVHDFDKMQDEDGAHKSVAMRILYGAVQARSSSTQKMDFSDWLLDIHKRGLQDICRIQQAILLLGGDPKKKCVLAVDEVNKLVEEIRRTGLQSEDASKSAMKYLTSAIGYSMQYSQIFSFMAGTLISEFATASELSGVSIDIIPLDILTRDEQYAILDAYPGLDGWRCSTNAKELLARQGGLPRLVEVLIDQIKIELCGTGNFGLISWVNVRDSLKRTSFTYSWRRNSFQLARSLVDTIMLRRPVTPQATIVAELPEITYETLQQRSQLVVQSISGEDYPTMPLFAFKRLISIAKTGDGDCDRFMKLGRLVDELMDRQMVPIEWQTFEYFASQHAYVMNQFFAQRSPTSPLLLSQLYAEGYGGAGQISIDFLKTHSDWIKCSARFPQTFFITCSNKVGSCFFGDGNHYFNASGASFADGFYASRIAGPSLGANQSHVVMSDNSLDTCPSLGLLGFQFKQRTAVKELNSNVCTTEHEKNTRAFKVVPEEARYRVITIIIATCRIPPPDDSRGFENILVIDITKFEQLYGILAPLMAPFSGRIDINTVTVKDLGTELGCKDTAEKIVKERGNVGFQDKEALHKRMSDAGVSLEQWKKDIDDWDF